MLFLRSARKWPTSEILNTFHAKTNIFKVRSCAGAAGKAKKNIKNTLQNYLNKSREIVDFLTFFMPEGLAAKMLPK